MIRSLLDTVLLIFSYLVLIRCVCSFLGTGIPNNRFFRFINEVTEPVLVQCRKILPPKGGVDYSPIIVFVAIFVLRSFI